MSAQTPVATPPTSSPLRNTTFVLNRPFYPHPHSGMQSHSPTPEHEPLLQPFSAPDSLRRKLRTYELAHALQHGFLPTTLQIQQWSTELLRLLDSRDRRLTPKAKETVRDVRAWIEAVTESVGEKNRDDKLQEFLWHTRRGGVTGGGLDAGETKELGCRLRKLLGMVIGNHEFRELAGELVGVAREVFAHQAKETAERAQGFRYSDMLKKEKGVEEVHKSIYRTVEEFKGRFPEGRKRGNVVKRLREVVEQFQGNKEFLETVEFLVEIGRRFVGQVKENVKKVEDDGDDFAEAVKDAKEILSRFASGKSLDDLVEAFRNLAVTIRNDEELMEFYDQITSEFQRIISQKDYAASSEAEDKAHHFYEWSQELLEEKPDRYRPAVDNLFDEISAFLNAVSQDRGNRRIVSAAKKVYYDIVRVNDNGQVIGVRMQVLRSIAESVLPRLANEIKYIPLPRIEYQDRDYDIVLENVVLESNHFIPAHIVFEAFQRAEFTNDYTFNSQYTATTRLRLKHINVFANDASFTFRKKTGLFRFKDQGLIDVSIDRRGASADIELEANTPEDDDVPRDSFFHVKKVTVYIYNFSYNYRAYHSWAANLLSPVIRPMVRTLLSKLLEQKIRSALETADHELCAASERLRGAQAAGGGSVEGWIKAVLNRPSRESRGGGGDWRVAVAEESLFPGERQAGEEQIGRKVRGGSARMRERGQENGGWRNDVFDVNVIRA